MATGAAVPGEAEGAGALFGAGPEAPRAWNSRKVAVWGSVRSMTTRIALILSSLSSNVTLLMIRSTPAALIAALRLS